jgi:hypothetical protein
VELLEQLVRVGAAEVRFPLVLAENKLGFLTLGFLEMDTGLMLAMKSILLLGLCTEAALDMAVPQPPKETPQPLYGAAAVVVVVQPH